MGLIKILIVLTELMNNAKLNKQHFRQTRDDNKQEMMEWHLFKNHFHLFPVILEHHSLIYLSTVNQFVM